MTWRVDAADDNVIGSEDGRWTIVRTPPRGFVRPDERPVLQLWLKSPGPQVRATLRLGPNTPMPAAVELLKRYAEGYDGA